MTKYIGAKVHVDLAAALERVAKSNDRTMAAEIKRAVREYIERQGTATASREAA